MELPPVELDRGSDVPLAVQLADALRRHTTAGLVRAGERLPSTRALATALGVSRTTIYKYVPELAAGRPSLVPAEPRKELG